MSSIEVRGMTLDSQWGLRIETEDPSETSCSLFLIQQEKND